MKPIINSIEDTDAYYDSMCVVARGFPTIPLAREQYISRDQTFRFPDGFESALQEQIESLANLRMTQEEFDWKRKNQPWLPLSYLNWKKDTFRFNPRYVKVKVTDGVLNMLIEGPVDEICHFETPLLSIISRLRFTCLLNEEAVKPADDWKDRIRRKFDQMVASKVSWIDFGTRRRFSYEIEDAICEIGQNYKPYFRGTANAHFAMKHHLGVHGTYPHKYVQMNMAKYGARMCNERAMFHWQYNFNGRLGIALTDTVTTPAFLKSFNYYYANLFTGVRQDSGNPHEIAEMIIKHYEQLGIDPTTKVIVFSDSLDAGLASTLSTKFSSRIKVTCGIGTNLTHDVGQHLSPMKHVIKAMAFNFGDRWIDVCKLSDTIGKTVGSDECVQHTKYDLGLK
jgi:nicotinate phosphoribosyltransferase